MPPARCLSTPRPNWGPAGHAQSHERGGGAPGDPEAAQGPLPPRLAGRPRSAPEWTAWPASR
eukprot:6710510-Alexandrium_andersonii.AAC.1